MAAGALTKHDLDVLEKIKDPESAPSAPLLIDDSLPRDPNITDPVLYREITQRERSVISSIQQIELQTAGLKPSSTFESALCQYFTCLTSFDELIEAYPNYASARNNRAQVLRRIYGDGMLVQGAPSTLPSLALDTEASHSTLMAASSTVLSDLDTAISLLTPRTPFAAISPQAAKTLSQAHTQRGALYHQSAKNLSPNRTAVRMDENRRETRWKVVDFEESAARDFMFGGRYGNEIAKALAVSTNPTAKLCGDMVREAMRKEYGGGEMV